MKLLVKIEADDEAAALYIEKLWAEYADDPDVVDHTVPTPQEWLRERVQDFLEDEAQVAFMFAGPEIGLTFEIVEES